MLEGELGLSLLTNFFSVHENVSKVVCWFDSVLVPARNPGEISEKSSEVSWVVAWDGVTDWTSEMDSTLVSVGTLAKTLGLRVEVTTEGTLDGISTVELLLSTEVTLEKTCRWRSEVAETSVETLGGTSDVRLWLI